MRRFTIAPDRRTGDRVTFDRDETRHLARVLRLRPGDTVVAADGRGHDYTVRLERLDETATGTVLSVATREPDTTFPITLLQGVPKGDKMETIVRAATELGVSRIEPVICERTIVRLEPGRWRERARRWQRVAKEATKQCGRAAIPDVDTPRVLGDVLGALPAMTPSELRLCLWEGEGEALHAVLARAREHARSAVVLIGPEGGLARTEVDAARAASFVVTSLGRRILRTDTAGPAIVAILHSHLGDLAGFSAKSPLGDFSPSAHGDQTP